LHSRKMEIAEFIEVYFQLGLKHKDITLVLASHHGYIITERHLKCILKSKSLFRRKDYNKIIMFIQLQLQSSGQLHGYRWMHAKCQENGLHVKKGDIRLILKALDSRGVHLRKTRRRTNYIWHLDSDDKLKPFDLCI
uniref:Uncharacterized protein n=1 Tax=Lepisosteus oculatus TaxID=7918 RepID=W5NLA5_LEPOC